MGFNEVSKCTEINCSYLDNLYFSLEDMNFEIWVVKATVRKLLLSSKKYIYRVNIPIFGHTPMFGQYHIG